MAIVTKPQVNGAPSAKQITVYDATELFSQRICKWQPASSLDLPVPSTNPNLLKMPRSLKSAASRGRAGHDLPSRR